MQPNRNTLLIAEDTTIYKPNLESIKERGESITPHDFLFVVKLAKERNANIRNQSEIMYNNFCIAVALYCLHYNPTYKDKFAQKDYLAMMNSRSVSLIKQYLSLAEYFKCDYELLEAYSIKHKTRSIRKLYAYTAYGAESANAKIAKYSMSFPPIYEQILKDITADRLNLGNERKAPGEKHYHLYRFKRTILANFASYKPLDNLDYLNYCSCFICNRIPTDHDKNVLMSVDIGRHINLPICKKCVPKKNLSIKNSKSKLISVIQLLVDYTKILEEIIDASSGLPFNNENEVARILSNKNYKMYDEKVLKPKKVKTPELGYKFSTNKSKDT